MGQNVIAPWRIIHIKFQDVEIRDGRGHGGRDQGVEGAVAVVRRDQYIVGMGHVADLLAHRNAIPGKVGHDDVLGVQLEEGAVAVQTIETFAGADRRLGRFANQAQGSGVKGFGLQPHQVVGFQRLRQFDRAAEFEGKGHIERNTHIWPQHLAKGADDQFGVAQHGRRGIAGMGGVGVADRGARRGDL